MNLLIFLIYDVINYIVLDFYSDIYYFNAKLDFNSVSVQFTDLLICLMYYVINDFYRDIKITVDILINLLLCNHTI
jgi:hypothetical protein